MVKSNAQHILLSAMSYYNDLGKKTKLFGLPNRTLLDMRTGKFKNIKLGGPRKNWDKLHHG
jgi:hypothetical protein